MSEANNPPAPPANDPAATPPATPPTASWTDSLAPELKGFVESRQFKDPASVVDAYRNLEKLRGVPKERLLTLPEKEDAPEWNDIYSRLGKPADPSEYGIKADGESKDFAEWAQKTFFDANMTKKQATVFAQKWDEYFKGQATAIEEKQQQQLAAQETALKKEWGAAFEQNTMAAKKAAVAFGLDGEKVDALEKALGFDGVMKLLHQIGSKVGESDFVSGKSTGGFGVLTPAAAQQKIKELRSDQDFVRRYTAGDAGAREEMAKLHKWAYPEG